jgi:hypothetical protein
MTTTAGTLMSDQTVRSSRPQRPRPTIIDQDGNEVRSASPFGGGSFSFQDLSGNFAAGGDFGGPGQGPNFGGMPFGNLTRAQRFARLDALSKLLDVAFVLPGTNVRYGIDGLIGLIPIVGDLLTTAISLWIVREARSLGAPRHIVARMLGNVALDGVVGLVPFAGDAFDVMFRANMRNMRLLKRWMDKQPRMD